MLRLYEGTSQLALSLNCSLSRNYEVSVVILDFVISLIKTDFDNLIHLQVKCKCIFLFKNLTLKI